MHFMLTGLCYVPAHEIRAETKFQRSHHADESRADDPGDLYGHIAYVRDEPVSLALQRRDCTQRRTDINPMHQLSA